MSRCCHLTRERVYSYMYIYTQTLPSIAHLHASLHNNLPSFKEQIQHYFKYTTNNPLSLLYITHIRHEQLTNNERSSVATLYCLHTTRISYQKTNPQHSTTTDTVYQQLAVYSDPRGKRRPTLTRGCFRGKNTCWVNC